MSVRAYRVVEIKTAGESFNIWHDVELCDFLGLNDKLNEDGCGLVEVPVEHLKEALKELKLSEHVRQSLEEDIASAEAKGEEYILYYCY